MIYIIEGATGSGKTFYSISESEKKGKFCYLAPCRQLVYETALKYGNLKTSSISTGEVKIKSENEKQLFAVYETSFKVTDFSSVILDEAHFLIDEERGGKLQEILSECKKENIDLFLVTATRNFKKEKGWKLVQLKEIQKFKKLSVSYNEFWSRVKEGVPSIVFRKYKNDCGNDGGVPITADTPASERLQAQLDFAKRKIKFIETTNVLAQGLNFPAQNILIEYNGWDNTEVILQKIGRLGRLGFNKEEEKLTYCVSSFSEKIIKKQIKKIKRRDPFSLKEYLILEDGVFDFSKNKNLLEEKLKTMPRHSVWVYGTLTKYNYRFYKFLKENFKQKENFLLKNKELEFYIKEEKKIKEILLNNLKD